MSAAVRRCGRPPIAATRPHRRRRRRRMPRATSAAGRDRAKKGGLGSAAIHLPDGMIVAAMVAVNAAGDVIDPATGKVVAGVRTPDGAGLADARVLLRSGAARGARPGEN